jgi:hypothetical protein
LDQIPGTNGTPQQSVRVPDVHQMLIFTLTPISCALGNDRFRAEMERLTGIRQHSVKPGPKPSAKTGPGSGEDNLEFLL